MILVWISLKEVMVVGAVLGAGASWAMAITGKTSRAREPDRIIFLSMLLFVLQRTLDLSVNNLQVLVYKNKGNW